MNNHACKLKLHKYSIKGFAVDYQISLPEQPHRETDIQQLIMKTYDLFLKVCAFYAHATYKARLIALCVYERIKNGNEVIGVEQYHHASLQAEWCHEVVAEDFFERHMAKIGSRIESFLSNGSSLRFCGFKHIHIKIIRTS